MHLLIIKSRKKTALQRAFLRRFEDAPPPPFLIHTSLSFENGIFLKFLINSNYFLRLVRDECDEETARGATRKLKRVTTPSCLLTTHISNYELRGVLLAAWSRTRMQR